jgi:hypothetical protein
MNAKQEATLNMQRVVEQHLDANTIIIAVVIAFQAAYVKLKAFNAQIIALVSGQETARTGVAKDKHTSKNNLAEVALQISKPIRAYALETRNDTLRDEVDYKLRDLTRLRDDQIAPRCQMIHERGVANLDAVKDYGVTDAKLTALQNAINSYSAIVPKPRAARAERSIQTAALKEIFLQSEEVLIVMDDLIDNFAAENPAFVETYKNLREIDKPPSRPRKPKVAKAEKVKDSENSNDAPK